MPQISSSTAVLASPGYAGVFDLQLVGPQPVEDFVRQLDALMRQGQVLKNDPSSLVSRVFWNGQDVVVKRYNHRGLWHSLRHTIKGSRAKRNWRSAQRLISLQITTPAPLAYVDQYRGPLLWQSYFVARFVPGPQVRQVFQDETVGAAQRQAIHDQVLKLLAVLAAHGISHGDMKHTNLLFDGRGIVLMDLDAMRIGGIPWLRRCRYRRDVNRYLRDLYPAHACRV
jgi:tRNA A-37 threonylcarbamoyl transferase component Bud32